MLDAAALSADLRTGMLGALDLHAVDGPELTALCDVIALAVVARITADAVVTVNGTGSTLTGAVAGAACSITAGAATGSIT